MKNKIFALLAVLLLACAVPCTAFADDSDTVASIATSESAEDLQSIYDDLNGGVDKYGGGLSTVFDLIKDTWDQVIAGPTQFALVFTDFVTKLFAAVPVYQVYLVLLFLLTISAAVLHKFFWG